MLKNKKLLLGLIFALALLLRLYNLGTYPALNADEAALGYNAYSLLQTGLDEHGNPWPINFQSFNDYKPGLTVYLIMPFVQLFGLNVWAVRILPALIGALSIFVMYHFVRTLGEQKLEIRNSTPKAGALLHLEIIASLFLAISPWHIHFSRGAWEVNIATFFMLTGAWLFLRATKNSKLYIVSAIVFALSLYTYHSARIISPLLVLGLIIIERKAVWRNQKQFLLSGVIAGMLLVPMAFSLFGNSGISRAAGVSIFADSGPINRINEQRGQHGDPENIFGELIHNKAVNYGLDFAENWGKHYWGEFLFLSGDDIQRNKVPETGQMYMLDVVFVVVGLIAIAKKPKGWSFVLWWLLVAPIAAALTFQSPHALRAENMVIPLIIICSFGLVNLLSLVKSKVFYILIGLVIVWGLGRYLLMYYGHMAKEYPYSSQYGMEEVVDFIKDRPEQNIIITDRYDQPYVLFLFYLNYPPEKFQQEHQLTERDVYGFSTVRSFDKYQFRSVKIDEDKPSYPNSLIIGTDEEIPDEANIIKEIQFPNGSPAFQIVKN